jgi:serine acetyltransferase
MTTPPPYAESEHTRDMGLWAMWREDYHRHQRDLSRPGLRALLVYRFGVWRMRCRFAPLRFVYSFFYRRLFHHVRNHYGIELPFSAQVGRRLTIEHQGGIVVHGSCVIGNDCYIRQGVTLGNKRLDEPFAAPRLGDRVNVGAGAKVLGGVRIGDGAAIGANAVVTKDVDSDAVMVGIPARDIRREGKSS